ncbi:MAG: hypothetical protein H8D78_14445 [Chloroflexi bacterium]|nr:hypothetical protein [Chloroflexota bacterium]
MVNLFVTPLGPGLVLLLAALALTFVRRRLPRWVSLVIALLAIISAGGLLLWLVASGQPGQFAWAWDPVTLPGGLWQWQIDGWSWLAVLLLLLLGVVAILMTWEEPSAGRSPTLAATLMLLAAASIFIFSANLLTLAASWVVLDVALGLRVMAERRGDPCGRPWALNSLGTLLLLGALLFAGPEGAQQALSAETAPLSVLALLLAALLRCGAYPLHIWLLPQEPRGRSGLITLHLIAPLTGLWLLGRAHGLAGPYYRLQPAWAAVGVLGMLGSGLAAWLAEEEGPRTAWVAINRISLTVLAAALAPEQGPAAIAWPLTMLTLGVGSLIVGQAISRRWGWRQLLGLAVLTLIGFPGTPGFPARFVLSQLTTLPILFSPLWLLALLAETLLAAALLPALLCRGAEVRRCGGAPLLPCSPAPLLLCSLIPAVLLAVPLLIWGLQPPFLASFAGLPGEDPIFQPLLAQARQISPLTWVSLLLPWAAGALLAWRRERLLAGLRGGREAVERVVRLEWGYRALGWAVERIADVLRGLGTVVEGEGYLGWLGLAALLGWLLWNL